jgi:hypothetical protein
MRRKGTPLQSAMSMLNFYINRAGKHLDASQRDVLKHAKDELRKLLWPWLKIGESAELSATAPFYVLCSCVAS